MAQLAIAEEKMVRNACESAYLEPSVKRNGKLVVVHTYSYVIGRKLAKLFPIVTASFQAMVIQRNQQSSTNQEEGLLCDLN